MPGTDGGSGAVADDYPGSRPWSFTGGTIDRVAVDVSGRPYLDLERAAAASARPRVTALSRAGY